MKNTDKENSNSFWIPHPMGMVPSMKDRLFPLFNLETNSIFIFDKIILTTSA